MATHPNLSSLSLPPFCGTTINIGDRHNPQFPPPLVNTRLSTEEDVLLSLNLIWIRRSFRLGWLWESMWKVLGKFQRLCQFSSMFVLSDTLAVEALQKMAHGKFRHLPVVDNGEVVALPDIAKCMYDAIARMERAAEKGKAIALAVEGVEKSWGSSTLAPNTFIEALRERIFRPSLSTILSEHSKCDGSCKGAPKVFTFKYNQSQMGIGRLQRSCYGNCLFKQDLLGSDDELGDVEESYSESDSDDENTKKDPKRKIADFNDQMDAANTSLRALKRLTAAKLDLSEDAEDHIYSNEDLQRIKELQAKETARTALTRHGLLKGSNSKSAPAIKIPSSDQLSLKPVDPSTIEAHIRRKMTKEQRVALMKGGREDRSEYKSKIAVKQKKARGII